MFRSLSPFQFIPPPWSPPSPPPPSPFLLPASPDSQVFSPPITSSLSEPSKIENSSAESSSTTLIPDTFKVPMTPTEFSEVICNCASPPSSSPYSVFQTFSTTPSLNISSIYSTSSSDGFPSIFTIPEDITSSCFSPSLSSLMSISPIVSKSTSTLFSPQLPSSPPETTFEKITQENFSSLTSAMGYAQPIKTITPFLNVATITPTINRSMPRLFSNVPAACVSIATDKDLVTSDAPVAMCDVTTESTALLTFKNSFPDTTNLTDQTSTNFQLQSPQYPSTTADTAIKSVKKQKIVKRPKKFKQPRKAKEKKSAFAAIFTHQDEFPNLKEESSRSSSGFQMPKDMSSSIATVMDRYKHFLPVDNTEETATTNAALDQTSQRFQPQQSLSTHANQHQLLNNIQPQHKLQRFQENFNPPDKSTTSLEKTTPQSLDNLLSEWLSQASVFDNDILVALKRRQLILQIQQQLSKMASSKTSFANSHNNVALSQFQPIVSDKTKTSKSNFPVPAQDQVNNFDEFLGNFLFNAIDVGKSDTSFLSLLSEALNKTFDVKKTSSHNVVQPSNVITTINNLTTNYNPSVNSQVANQLKGTIINQTEQAQEAALSTISIQPTLPTTPSVLLRHTFPSPAAASLQLPQPSQLLTVTTQAAVNQQNDAHMSQCPITPSKTVNKQQRCGYKKSNKKKNIPLDNINASDLTNLNKLTTDIYVTDASNNIKRDLNSTVNFPENDPRVFLNQIINNPVQSSGNSFIATNPATPAIAAQKPIFRVVHGSKNKVKKQRSKNLTKNKLNNSTQMSKPSVVPNPSLSLDSSFAPSSLPSLKNGIKEIERISSSVSNLFPVTSSFNPVINNINNAISLQPPWPTGQSGSDQASLLKFIANQVESQKNLLQQKNAFAVEAKKSSGGKQASSLMPKQTDKTNKPSSSCWKNLKLPLAGSLLEITEPLRKKEEDKYYRNNDAIAQKNIVNRGKIIQHNGNDSPFHLLNRLDNRKRTFSGNSNIISSDELDSESFSQYSQHVPKHISNTEKQVLYQNIATVPNPFEAISGSDVNLSEKVPAKSSDILNYINCLLSILGSDKPNDVTSAYDLAINHPLLFLKMYQRLAADLSSSKNLQFSSKSGCGNSGKSTIMRLPKTETKRETLVCGSKILRTSISALPSNPRLSATIPVSSRSSFSMMATTTLNTAAYNLPLPSSFASPSQTIHLWRPARPPPSPPSPAPSDYHRSSDDVIPPNVALTTSSVPRIQLDEMIRISAMSASSSGRSSIVIPNLYKKKEPAQNSAPPQPLTSTLPVFSSQSVYAGTSYRPLDSGNLVYSSTFIPYTSCARSIYLSGSMPSVQTCKNHTSEAHPMWIHQGIPFKANGVATLPATSNFYFSPEMEFLFDKEINNLYTSNKTETESKMKPFTNVNLNSNNNIASGITVSGPISNSDFLLKLEEERSAKLMELIALQEKLLETNKITELKCEILRKETREANDRLIQSRQLALSSGLQNINEATDNQNSVTTMMTDGSLSNRHNFVVVQNDTSSHATSDNIDYFNSHSHNPVRFSSDDNMDTGSVIMAAEISSASESETNSNRKSFSVSSVNEIFYQPVLTNCLSDVEVNEVGSDINSKLAQIESHAKKNILKLNDDDSNSRDCFLFSKKNFHAIEDQDKFDESFESSRDDDHNSSASYPECLRYISEDGEMTGLTNSDPFTSFSKQNQENPMDTQQLNRQLHQFFPDIFHFDCEKVDEKNYDSSSVSSNVNIDALSDNFLFGDSRTDLRQADVSVDCTYDTTTHRKVVEDWKDRNNNDIVNHQEVLLSNFNEIRTHGNIPNYNESEMNVNNNNLVVFSKHTNQNDFGGSEKELNDRRAELVEFLHNEFTARSCQSKEEISLSGNKNTKFEATTDDEIMNFENPSINNNSELAMEVGDEMEDLLDFITKNGHEGVNEDASIELKEYASFLTPTNDFSVSHNTNPNERYEDFNQTYLANFWSASKGRINSTYSSSNQSAPRANFMLTQEDNESSIAEENPPTTTNDTIGSNEQPWQDPFKLLTQKKDSSFDVNCLFESNSIFGQKLDYFHSSSNEIHLNPNYISDNPSNIHPREAAPSSYLQLELTPITPDESPESSQEMCSNTGSTIKSSNITGNQNLIIDDNIHPRDDNIVPRDDNIHPCDDNIYSKNISCDKSNAILNHFHDGDFLIRDFFDDSLMF